MTADDPEDQRSVEVGEPAVGPRTVSSDAAFKTIGNETRLAILDTLWGPNKLGTETFTDLRKAVGMRDGSQFHFHLKKLVEGGFIQKVDGQYTLRQAGARAICIVHGGDMRACPRWELPWTIDTSALEVVSDDPLRLRLTVAIEDDVRVLTLDEAFDVVSVA